MRLMIRTRQIFYTEKICCSLSFSVRFCRSCRNLITSLKSQIKWALLQFSSSINFFKQQGAYYWLYFGDDRKVSFSSYVQSLEQQLNLDVLCLGYIGRFTWENYLRYTKTEPVPSTFFPEVNKCFNCYSNYLVCE